MDAATVAACVCEAYVHYIERIGRQPGPMLEDYASVVKDSMVHVAAEASRVVGLIVLMNTGEGFFVDNEAVRPAVKAVGTRAPFGARCSGRWGSDAMHAARVIGA